MNRLSAPRRLDLILALCDGASLRAASRAAGVSINTATKLLQEAGARFAAFHDAQVRAVQAAQVVCYKGWVPIGGRPDPPGEVCTWAAIDGDTGLLVSYLTGGRDAATMLGLLEDLRGRTVRAPPKASPGNLRSACADDEPFAISLGAAGDREGWMFPATGAVPAAIIKALGRRFTFTPNGRPRRVEHLNHLVAIYFVWANFMRATTDGPTPAMAAGLTSRPWTRSDLSAVLEGVDP